MDRIDVTDPLKEDEIIFSKLNNVVDDPLMEQHLLTNIKLECDASSTDYIFFSDVKEEVPQLTPGVKYESEAQNNDRNNLIQIKEECKNEDDCIDSDVILEREIIYLPCVDEENVLLGYCDICNTYYNSYCMTCPMLACLLDNNTLTQTMNRSTETLPTNILRIQRIEGHTSVCTTRSIPKGVTLGPFDGLEPIQVTTGCAWKLRNGKPVVIEYKKSNWLQYIDCAMSPLERNVITFQCNGSLYLQTVREIYLGETLFAFYADHMAKNNANNIYCYPKQEEILSDIYACTYCCLGFSSKKYLLNHKKTCIHAKDLTTFAKDIVMCAFCKIYLDFKENSNHHMRFCCVKYAWKGRQNISIQYHIELTPTFIDNEFDSSKQYICQLCSKTFQFSRILNLHMKYDHHLKNASREYKCDKCDFKSLSQFNFLNHKNSHEDVQRSSPILQGVKSTTKCIENINSNVNERNECACSVCSKSVQSLRLLNLHIEYEHRRKDISSDNHCDKSDFKTPVVSHLLSHNNTHNGTKVANYKEDDIHCVEDEFNLTKYICRVCLKALQSLRKLNLHMEYEHQIKDGLSEYICDKCDFKTLFEFDLLNHKTVHEGSRLNLSNKQRPTMSYIENNINCIETELDLPTQYICRICSTTLQSLETLNLHMESEHQLKNAVKEYKCDKCDFKALSKSNFLIHKNFHKYVKLNQSIAQGIESIANCLENEEESLSHSKNIQKTGILRKKKFKCTKCSFTTGYKRTYIYHQWRHDDVRPIKCTQCDETFKSTSSRKLHIRKVHSPQDEAPPTQYICHLCSKSLQSSWTLNAHLEYVHRVKSDKEKYECDKCNFKTFYGSSLQSHKSVHEEITPYHCPNCNRRFKKKENLKNHVILIHSDADKKGHKCTKCNFKTFRKACLVQHLWIHDIIKPFVCQICNRKFRQETHLKTHLKLIHNATIHKDKNLRRSKQNIEH